MPRPGDATPSMLRRSLLVLGMAVAAVGLGSIAASFALPSAYLNNRGPARTYVQLHRGVDRRAPLLYDGYEADVEEAAITLMNAGLFVTLAGIGLAAASRARSRP